MKVELLETDGTLTIAAARDTLSLVLPPDEVPSEEQLGQLTPLELQMAYDWAMREHLSAAGNRVQRRAKPFGVRVGALSNLTYEQDVEVIREQAKEIAQVCRQLNECRARIVELEESIEESAQDVH